MLGTCPAAAIRCTARVESPVMWATAAVPIRSAAMGRRPIPRKDVGRADRTCTRLSTGARQGPVGPHQLAVRRQHGRGEIALAGGQQMATSPLLAAQARGSTPRTAAQARQRMAASAALPASQVEIRR